MPAMGLAFDRVFAPAAWLSIAAAMVIAQSALEILLTFPA
jgi:hypothetical protein